MGWKLPCADCDGHTGTQSAAQTYPHPRPESAEEAGVLTPQRLHFLLMTGQQVSAGQPTAQISRSHSNIS